MADSVPQESQPAPAPVAPAPSNTTTATSNANALTQIDPEFLEALLSSNNLDLDDPLIQAALAQLSSSNNTTNDKDNNKKRKNDE